MPKMKVTRRLGTKATFRVRCHCGKNLGKMSTTRKKSSAKFLRTCRAGHKNFITIPPTTLQGLGKTIHQKPSKERKPKSRWTGKARMLRRKARYFAGTDFPLAQGANDRHKSWSRRLGRRQCKGRGIWRKNEPNPIPVYKEE